MSPEISPMPRRFITAMVVLAFAASAGACTGAKPSRADCDKFVEKFGELLQKEDAEGKTVRKLALKQRERVLELCTANGTRAEVLCTLEQESFEDVAKNCK